MFVRSLDLEYPAANIGNEQTLLEPLVASHYYIQQEFVAIKSALDARLKAGDVFYWHRDVALFYIDPVKMQYREGNRVYLSLPLGIVGKTHGEIDGLIDYSA